MKKFIIVAGAITMFSCGSQKVAQRELIRVSEFSIITNAKDTLYLKEGDQMAEHIRENWDNGEFRKYEDGVYTHVVMVTESQFNSLTNRCSSNVGESRGLTNLGNRH